MRSSKSGFPLYILENQIDFAVVYSDAMEDNEDETEEEEGNKILQEVLDDIGINLSQKVGRYHVLMYITHFQLLTYDSRSWEMHRQVWSPLTQYQKFDNQLQSANLRALDLLP